MSRPFWVPLHLAPHAGRECPIAAAGVWRHSQAVCQSSPLRRQRLLLQTRCATHITIASSFASLASSSLNHLMLPFLCLISSSVSPNCSQSGNDAERQLTGSGVSWDLGVRTSRSSSATADAEPGLANCVHRWQLHQSLERQSRIRSSRIQSFHAGRTPPNAGTLR